MREEVKELWITALEGDEYTQGHSVLTDENGRDCCLGVLCKLAFKAGVIPEPVQIGGRWEYGEDRADLVLPEAVAKWAELPAVGDDPDGGADFLNPRVPNPDYGSDDIDNALLPEVRIVSLAELNDADNYDGPGEAFQHRYDFQAIANIIREHL